MVDEARQGAWVAMEPEESRMAWLPSKQYSRMVDGEREDRDRAT